MYYLGQSYKKFSFVLVCISIILVSYCISAASDEEIFKSRPKQKPNAKQFPNLSFVGLNLIQSRSNLFGGSFGKSTTTRTILSTVATITAASFRTCTTSAAALTPCAGRRRRDLSGENELDGEHDNDMMTRVRQNIEATPSIKLIIDKTEITDPVSVAEILNEKPKAQNYQISEDESVLETTTINSQVLLERNLDGTTTELYPSQDATSSSILNDDVTSVNDINSDVDDDATGLGTTVETPYSDSIDTTLDSLNLNDDDDKARVGLGQGGVVTVTSMIPITHVVQTAATGTSATLTVMYAGCLPPSLPVYGQQCTM